MITSITKKIYNPFRTVFLLRQRKKHAKKMMISYLKIKQNKPCAV